MCGIAGFLHAGSLAADESSERVRRMADALIHRGPDDAGVWIDPSAGIALSHRRLAILELSAAGHQPMISRCGRYVLVFNGEIYNHLEMREAIASVSWRGHSDTETLLETISDAGVDAALRRAAGMFAFALWDRDQRTLTLARDRLGEKPLYYGWQGNWLFFASELKALRRHPEFVGKVDRGAVAALLQYNSIPAPVSIYQGINKLPPGTSVALSIRKRAESPQPYWRLGEVAREEQAVRRLVKPEAAIDGLESVLRAAIARQMMADVPVGAFLSGGVDSSAVVALMKQVTSAPVRTFSIGFAEASFNEAEYARAVATHLGTDHSELLVTGRMALEVIPELPQIYDEPFADSSQIPTILVSRLARRSVAVALSGDGGDELFGGYNRYMIGPRIHRAMRPLPSFAHAAIRSTIRAVPAAFWNYFGAVLRRAELGDKCRKIAEIVPATDLVDMYRILRTQWKSPDVLHEDGRAAWGNALPEPFPGIDSPERILMYMDAVSYLPDDILVKVDRSAMSCSLETRVPFLDPEVVRYSWSLPLELLIRNGVGKWALRQLLYRHVPQKLIDRPKRGFAIPIGDWLRGPLRDWAENLLQQNRLQQQGFLNASLVRQRWDEHLSRRKDWQHHLWSVLMFQAWLAARS